MTVDLQDVFNCMCLSEGVYKVVDYGEEKATQILGAILEGFPPGLVSLKRVEWSRPDSNHRQGARHLASMQSAANCDAVRCSCALSPAFHVVLPLPAYSVPAASGMRHALPCFCSLYCIARGAI